MHVLHIVQVIDGEVEGEWHKGRAVYCSRSLRETSTGRTLCSMSQARVIPPACLQDWGGSSSSMGSFHREETPDITLTGSTGDSYE